MVQSLQHTRCSVQQTAERDEPPCCVPPCTDAIGVTLQPAGERHRHACNHFTHVNGVCVAGTLRVRQLRTKRLHARRVQQLLPNAQGTATAAHKETAQSESAQQPLPNSQGTAAHKRKEKESNRKENQLQDGALREREACEKKAAPTQRTRRAAPSSSRALVTGKGPIKNWSEHVADPFSATAWLAGGAGA